MTQTKQEMDIEMSDTAGKSGANKPEEKKAVHNPSVPEILPHKLGEGQYAVVYALSDTEITKIHKADKGYKYENDGVNMFYIHEVGMMAHLNVIAAETNPEKMSINMDRLYELKKSDEISVGKGFNMYSDLVTHLHYMHSLGIFHGDICERNIMLDKDGKAQFIDFGISHFEELAYLSPGLGGFIPPEHKKLRSKANRKTDIYSLGAVMIKLLVGSMDFIQLKTREEVEKYLATKLVSQFPKLLSHMVDPNPETRWSTRELLKMQYYNTGDNHIADLTKIDNYKFVYKHVIEWIRDVCFEFKLSLACFINCIRMIRMFYMNISKSEHHALLKRETYQLYATSCFSICYKLFHRVIVDFKLLNECCNGVYTAERIRDCEVEVICVLRCRVYFPRFSFGKFGPAHTLTKELANQVIKQEMFCLSEKMEV